MKIVKTPDQLVLEARPAAIRFAKEIGEMTNKKWPNGAQMAGVVASITLQNIIISLACMMHPGGSPEGAEFVENVFEGSKKDAIIRWAQLDPHLVPPIEA